MSEKKDKPKLASAARFTLEEIKKRGHEGVRVLDDSRIDEMVADAVERVMRERNLTLLDEERSRLTEQVRSDFGKLIASEKQAITREKQLSKQKANLDREMEKVVALLKQIGAGQAGADQVAVLAEQLNKINARQKNLFEKYHAVDSLKRKAEAEMIEYKEQMLKLLQEIESMKARGEVAPSRYIEEASALKDQRDDLRRKLALQHRILRAAAVADYARANHLPEPTLPPKGHGVGIIVGDRNTKPSGIKVRYEPGNPEPIVELPE